MLGVNCGVINSSNPCSAKCCAEQPFSVHASIPGIFNVLPGAQDVVDDFLRDKLNPILEYKRQVTMQPCINMGSPTTPGDLSNAACVCLEPTPATLSAILNLCQNIKNTNERDACNNCLQGNTSDRKVGVWTGIGCVYSDINGFIQHTLLGWGIGLAGGISMLCILYAAFMMQTSRGNAEVVKKAQQLMTSCITGLMLIIFSVFILRLIGITILRIPGFN